MSNLYSYDARTISFHIYDTHVKKIPEGDMDSIKRLLEYMEQPITKGDPNRNLYMARSFIVWISTMIGWRKKYRLPLEIRTLIEKLPAVTFKELCGAADIPCELVLGKGKDISYCPGETPFENLPQTSWNTFRSGNKWHLVSPDLATVAFAGHERGGVILLESDGKRNIREIQASEGYSTAMVNDFWFCTKPRIFAVHLFPEDINLQLLDKESVSQSDFETMAYLQPGFFMAQLNPLTDNKCILISKNGCSSITFGANPSVMSTLKFKYKLSFVADTGDLGEIDPAEFPRMVMQANGSDTITFTLRLPVTGEYIFKISVMCPGVVKNSECCEFRIICTEAFPTCAKLPIDAGDTAFGYGYKARDIGVGYASHTAPIISVRTGRDEIPGRKSGSVDFKVDYDRVNDVEFSSDLIVEDENDGYAKTKFDREKGNLKIQVEVEREGEFALVVNAKERTEGEFTPIMRYLVTTYDNDDGERENMVKHNKRKLNKYSKIEQKNEEKTNVENKIDTKKKEIEELKRSLGMSREKR